MKFLLPNETIAKRILILDRIIGGLTASINTIENKRTNDRNVTRHTSPVTQKDNK